MGVFDVVNHLLRSAALGAILVGAAVPASAAPILTVQVLSVPVVGARGETVDVFASLGNAATSEGSVDVDEFIGVSGNGDAAVGAFDGSWSDLFLLPAPALAAGDSIGPVLLGTFTFADDATVGQFASFTVDVEYLFGTAGEVGTDTVEFRAMVVPEPMTVALVGLGLAGWWGRRRA